MLFVSEITNKMTRNSYKAKLYPVELQTRGIPAKFLNFVVVVGLFMNCVYKVAHQSYYIWLDRERSESSAGGCCLIIKFHLTPLISLGH